MSRLRTLCSTEGSHGHADLPAGVSDIEPCCSPAEQLQRVFDGIVEQAKSSLGADALSRRCQSKRACATVSGTQSRKRSKKKGPKKTKKTKKTKEDEEQEEQGAELIADDSLNGETASRIPWAKLQPFVEKVSLGSFESIETGLCVCVCVLIVAINA